MSRESVERLMREHAALRRPDADPELEAIRAAILLEDVTGVAFADAEIDPAVFGDPSSAAAAVARLGGDA